jgi:hypothetical protein
MQSHTRTLIAVVGIGLGLMMPLRLAWANSQFFQQLSAASLQWQLSIPASENPILDKTGAKCLVGQRGSVWFLVPDIPPDTPTTRTCAVPEGKVLFVGLTISIQADIPNVCGQGPEHIPIEDLYASAAAFQDGVTVTDLTLDGERINDLHRVQSPVFEL